VSRILGRLAKDPRGGQESAMGRYIVIRCGCLACRGFLAVWPNIRVVVRNLQWGAI